MIPLPQLMYQNVQQQVTEGEGCDECFDGPCDQSCDHQEEEQPLMKTNNYQFCWKALSSNQSANQSLFNKDQKTGMISSLQPKRHSLFQSPESRLISYFLPVVPALQTDEQLRQACDLPLLHAIHD